MEKRHVGRPTNEEVKARKNKKLVKISLLVSFCLIVIASVILLTTNTSKLVGATNTNTKGKVTGKLIYPIKGNKGVWSEGTRTSSDHLHYAKSYGGDWHGGNDVENLPKGNIVVAMDGGVVIAADDTTNKCSNNKNKICKSEGYVHFGKFVLIEHAISGKKYYTVYGHLNKITVKKGDKVNQGDKIGESGNNGNSSGPHLHVAMSYNTYDAKLDSKFKGYPIYRANVIAPYVYIDGAKKGKSYVGDTGKNLYTTTKKITTQKLNGKCTISITSNKNGDLSYKTSCNGNAKVTNIAYKTPYTNGFVNRGKSNVGNKWGTYKGEASKIEFAMRNVGKKITVRAYYDSSASSTSTAHYTEVTVTLKK